MRVEAARRRDLSMFPLQVRSVSGTEMLIEVCANGPQTQRPPHPAAQVLGWLFECERMQIAHSFALLKHVRLWQDPSEGWNSEYLRLRIRPSLAGPLSGRRPFFSFEGLGSQTNQKNPDGNIPCT